MPFSLTPSLKGFTLLVSSLCSLLAGTRHKLQQELYCNQLYIRELKRVVYIHLTAIEAGGRIVFV
jgi:hypothetical protein